MNNGIKKMLVLEKDEPFSSFSSFVITLFFCSFALIGTSLFTPTRKALADETTVVSAELQESDDSRELALPLWKTLQSKGDPLTTDLSRRDARLFLLDLSRKMILSDRLGSEEERAIFEISTRVGRALIEQISAASLDQLNALMGVTSLYQ